ncbi:TonB-dependent receptor plug domain-containing protein [Pedobacter sp.]|uniref:carboxypeptidase-like regulatory domain-containing protein n=1 Tax=Pedobacter sp. TaxID=1411316 RepID=UPI003D7FE784
MKTKYILALSLLLGISLFAAFKIEDDPFSLLLKKMETYNKKHVQEKVHLHLDKPYYAIGDDIWFKAYLVNTLDNRPSTLSNLLYVELINEVDSVKKQLLLPVMGGITWGDFKLTDSLQEGNYRIRAYTKWMRNAGTEFMYDKTIKIGNAWANKVFTKTGYKYSTENNAQKVNTTIKFSDKNETAYAGAEVNYVVQLNFKNAAKGKITTNKNGEINFDFLNTSNTMGQAGKIIATINLPNKQKVVKTIPITATSNDISVQFFPEGGNFVENLPTKIGIKAVNSNGLGKDISGTIVDQNGAEVTKFNTAYLGMGNLVINPQPGMVYTASITHADGSKQQVKLPPVQPAGYVMMVNNLDTAKINVKIYLSENLLSDKELKLVAQHNGTVYAVAKVKNSKQLANLSIPKKELPTGIIQLTVFNDANLPVAERLVFVKNAAETVNLQINSNQKEYGKREKVNLNITADAPGQPFVGSLSVAVTNNNVVTPDLENESNILTTLLLTSDLPGYIEKPNHYFLNDDESTLEQLDNLLLTQGWRRFLWKNVISNSEPVIRYQPEKNLTISGTLVNLSGKPIANGKVSLFSTAGGLMAIDTLSDAQGRFVFDNLSFPDSTKFVVQGRTEKNKKNTDIKLDIQPGQVVTRNKNTGDIVVNINESISSYIQKSENYFDELTKRGVLQRTVVLEEVNIVATKNPAKNSSNLNGAGHADAVITADQLSNCFSLLQCLQGRVAGLVIRDNTPYLMRFGASTPMQVIVDGMYVEADFLDAINVQDVETIEVLKSVGNLAIYGSQGGGGILIVTTKRGGSTGYSNYAPGIVTYTPKGLSYMRQFYSPDYEAQPNNTAPDFRTTIYWNPQLITDATGKATFNYFNSDEPGIYRVLIEGINASGQLARATYTYEVK